MSEIILTQAEQKILAGRCAVDTLVNGGEIFSGMKIGLGTGSTVEPAILRIAELISEGKLKDIAAVATSFQTLMLCEEKGIPVYSLNSKKINGHLHLAIDGADQIDLEKNLTKGGGAALLLEKIVAYSSDSFVVVADESKKTKRLGLSFPLPVEIIPEARQTVILQLEKRGIKAVLRNAVKKMGPVITDNGNFILDLTWSEDSAFNAREEETELNKIAGIVENGLFTRKVPRIFIASSGGKVEDF